MSKKQLVVSTVGASLLNHHLDRNNKEEREIINALANKATLSPEEDAQVESIVARARRTLVSGDIKKIQRSSAELNGIFALYGGQIERGTSDMHFLITTDTALGRCCAELVKDYLLQHKISTDIFVPERLTVASTEDFEQGSKSLIHWCDENIPAYKEQGYDVVFNLVAAFKALQGYLNTIGMFHADRILYLFENAQPIFIPRLPIQIDWEAIKRFAVQLALMNEADALVPLQDVADLSPTLYDHDGESAMQSPWGLLIWNQMRKDAFSSSLLPFPRLSYATSFERDFKQTNIVEHKVRLQSSLAKVSAKLIDSNGDPSVLKGGEGGGILYDNYEGKTAQGQPIGHFRISGSLRVSCIAQGSGLTLRHFGEHDYVNKNP